MPSTHLSLHFHVVFSTKDRMPQISSEWREKLHSYIGGVVKNAGAIPEAVGGVADHVHLLLGLPATLALADIIRTIKANSSKWIHDEIGLEKFAWQEGYGASTVSPGNREAVSNYIGNQEEHHRTRGFQEEYMEFLRKAKVGYDERFLW